MAIGAVVRRLSGRYEHQVAEAYRSMFVNVDDFIATVRTWVPDAREILEVGCGEGAVTERLVRSYPAARITGIDISPRVGRLYRGPTDHVRFLERTVQEVAAIEPGRYDLVLLADVLHHVPLALRTGLIEAIAATMSPGGAFVFKDWSRAATPIHWLGFGSDRFLTGDRINYMNRAEARAALAGTFGDAALVDEQSIRPWRNNFAILVRP